MSSLCQPDQLQCPHLPYLPKKTALAVEVGCDPGAGPPARRELWLRTDGRPTDVTAASPEPAGPVANGTAWMGRHSLAIYLIHQPVLLGLLIPLANWLG